MIFKKVTESTLYFDVFSKAMLDCWIGIIRSAVFFVKLSIIENLLHLVNLFYTSNLRFGFRYNENAASFLNRTSVEFPKSYWYDLFNSCN
jgi:hypothetical protein